jgi:hypothetical protein
VKKGPSGAVFWKDARCQAQSAVVQIHFSPRGVFAFAIPSLRHTSLAIETAVWEPWKNYDANRLSDLLAENISFINIFGICLANKAEALQNWSGTGCDVKRVGVTDTAATMLSPTVGILTFKATADSKCSSERVAAIWGSSIYVKYGNAWKWTVGINVPARAGNT